MVHPSDILQLANIEAFLVSHSANIRYLTGVENDGGLLLISARGMTMFVYALDNESTKKNVRSGVRVKDISSMEHALKNVHRCGFESDDVSVSVLAKWKRKFKNTKFVRSMGLIEEWRRQKSSKELHMIRSALRMTEVLLSGVPARLKKCPTEKELAWLLESQAHTLGAEGLAFEPIVAFGSHTSRPHHRPTDRKLKKGDLVQIDIGARVHGYCADRSEIYFTGKPSLLEKHVYASVWNAKNIAIAAVKPGVTTHVLDQIARTVLRKDGFEKYFCHGLGHGVGLDIHEGVSISSKGPDIPLLKNEVITIEPGVYIPGKFGMRLEDMVFV